ncbi:MAG: UV DNA damage repair endonuclease UvsE [Candidatus Bathyarchaeia archaeon]|jgi:UV DNA damage endonuclease
MKIGYPCINITVGCTSGHTFRLKSYSEDRLKETVKTNLQCLKRTLQYNKEHSLLFFRVCSGLVPFASHPVNIFNWQQYFKADFEAIGGYIKQNGFRISVHPDQFTLINSLSEEIFERSKKELQYHAQILDLMQLDTSAKIQIHVGGAYGNKPKSIQAFVERYGKLDEEITRRLVIENDERLFDVDDCLEISSKTGIPVLFDVFHHKVNHRSEDAQFDFASISKTWKGKDGLPMVDYSSQKPEGKLGQHTQSIDLYDFEVFLKSTRPFDFDVMLEIKDKEESAIKALKAALNDPRIKI